MVSVDISVGSSTLFEDMEYIFYFLHILRSIKKLKSYGLALFTMAIKWVSL